MRQDLVLCLPLRNEAYGQQYVTRTRLVARLVAFLACGLGTVLAASTTSDTPAAAVSGDDRGCDFNGDGDDDLAIGRPWEYWVSADESGAVQVLYGTDAGLTADGNQWWDQATPGVAGAPEGWDYFGQSLACGDFDRDAFDDLAIGIPFEGLGTVNGAGAIQVLYGSAAGLTAEGAQSWDQSTPGVIGAPEPDDRFGWSLAAGDFDGDDFDDLAIGVPGEAIASRLEPRNIDAAGVVQVLHGSATGLSADRDQWWEQELPEVSGGSESWDRFGWSLAAGDFDGDGADDLAVGVPYENLGATVDAGAVQVFYGSATGLTADGNAWWDQNVAGVPGLGELHDRFGWSLAAGDFDGDGADDLAVGVPFEDVMTTDGAGAVEVLYGSPTGVTADRAQWWSHLEPTVSGPNQFGASLAAGDLAAGAEDELVIGVPDDDLRPLWGDAGAVEVLIGGDDGLTDVGAQVWDQDTPGVPGVREARDMFGFAVATGDFDGQDGADLAIGAPGDGVGGSVQVLYNGGAGVSSDGAQSWDQDTEGILGLGEDLDRFGSVLAGG